MNRTLILKVVVVGALALLLMLPVAMIRDLVAERQARRNEAITGIAEGWGKRQTIAVPCLVLPYERYWGDNSESNVVRVPVARLEWTVGAEISDKARGIYRARLYDARVRAQGAIELPARGSLEDGASRYKWGTPYLVLAISDPLGIRAAPDLTFDGARHPFVSRAKQLQAPLELQLGRARTVEFSLALELAGSEALSIAPAGADTSIAMRADWPHPSFQGRFLPAKHDIRPDGFTASWQISRFATTGADDEQIVVSFVQPASLYQRLERASKYGFLFVGLTFAAFMLFELLRRLAIHPIQYTLVGLALGMFFLLLTALSEHIAFAHAYAAASLACVGLVTAYVVRVLRSTRFGLAFGAALAAVYAMLYALLQAEDYSLLGGSLVLFALLAAAMLGTRRVDWYALTTPRQA